MFDTEWWMDGMQVGGRKLGKVGEVKMLSPRLRQSQPSAFGIGRRCQCIVGCSESSVQKVYVNAPMCTLCRDGRGCD